MRDNQKFRSVKEMCGYFGWEYKEKEEVKSILLDL